MFKSGFAKNIITPARGVPLCGYFNPRPNIGVYDDLCVKALLMEKDGLKAGIVSFDLCFPGEDLLEAVFKAAQKASIDYLDNIIFCATHTHTAPYSSSFFGDPPDKDYLENTAEKTVDAILRAEKSLAETEMFTGKAFCDTLAFNRRYWMKNGKVVTNPGKLNVDIVKPEGPVDYDIPMAVLKQNGVITAILANIVNHSDTIGGETVSADWPGRMEREIQNALGYDVPVMTLLGCSGNINHFDINWADPQTSYEEAKRIGKGYAEVLVKALPSLQQVNISEFRLDSSSVRIPFCVITDEQCKEAQELLERTSHSESNGNMTSEGLASGDGPVARFFAQQLLAYAKNHSGKSRVFRMLSMKFGNEFALVSLPGEVFTEIGMDIKKASRFPQNMVVELAMGDCGYVPLPECFSRGGYEILPVEGGGPDHNTAIQLRKEGIALLNK